MSTLNLMSTCVNAEESGEPTPQESSEPNPESLPGFQNGPGSDEGAASTSRSGLEDYDASRVEIRKLHVGNIHSRATTQELRDTFGSFGLVKNAHFARKKDGTRDSFAFVTYYEPLEAARALESSINCGICLHGAVVTVNKASLKHQPRKLPSGKILWRQPTKPAYSSKNTCAYKSKAYSRKASKAAPVDVEIDESKCFIKYLNDDCLMHIFSFLPRKELVKSERVCKHWQNICIQMWLYIKELDFSWLSAPYYQYEDSKPLNRHILERYLSRCGSNLTSLDVSYRFVKVDVRALNVIAMECQNLKCLNLSYCPIGKKGFKILSEIGGSLERVLLESCGMSTNDSAMLEFLGTCINLKSIVLSNNCNLTGECLKGLNGDTLEELVLDNCNGLQTEFTRDSFVRFVNLKKLSINGCISINLGMLDDILKSIPQLSCLSMSMNYPKLYNSALCRLAQLTELVSLTLFQNPAVNDTVLRVISQSCKKLVHLDISGCSVHSVENSLSDEGVAHVALMPALSHLKMCYMALLTDESLLSLAEPARLKSLECRGCPTFTDHGCSRIIELSTELELFDISGCSFVSGRTLENALSAVKLRTNNVKLKLVCGGTSIWACSQTDPLLDVDLTDLCIDRLRPDFVDDIYFLSDSDGLDDDDMDNFDWECQSMFLEDGDLGDWYLSHINNGFYDSDDYDDDDYYPF